MQSWRRITPYDLMKNIFFSVILGFAPYWDYKANKWISENILNKIPID